MTVYCNGEIEVHKSIDPEDEVKILEAFPEEVRNRISIYSKYIRVEDSIGFFDVDELKKVGETLYALGYDISHTPRTKIDVYGDHEGSYVYDDRGFVYLNDLERGVYFVSDDGLIREVMRRGLNVWFDYDKIKDVMGELTNE